MNLELVIYQIDSQGRRTIEHGHTTILSPADLQSIADTLHSFSTTGRPLTFADELESIVDAL